MKSELSIEEAIIGEIQDKIRYIENILDTTYLASEYTEEGLDALADQMAALVDALYEMGAEG